MINNIINIMEDMVYVDKIQIAKLEVLIINIDSDSQSAVEVLTSTED